jgi:hypothetical protein
MYYSSIIKKIPLPKPSFTPEKKANWLTIARLNTHHSNVTAFRTEFTKAFTIKLRAKGCTLRNLNAFKKKHQPDLHTSPHHHIPEVAALAVELAFRVLHVHESITIYNDLRAEEGIDV